MGFLNRTITKPSQPINRNNRFLVITKTVEVKNDSTYPYALTTISGVRTNKPTPTSFARNSRRK